jgi:hypothetical protein
VEIKSVPGPAPGPGEVLVQVKASTICGSNIRGAFICPACIWPSLCFKSAPC